MNNIFVGNLSFQATKEDVIKLFEPFGSVANAVIMERKKGKSRGFGFVDMPNEEEKNAAIAALHGKEFMWRPLSVSILIPKVKGESKLKEFKPAKKEWKPSESRAVPRKSKAWVKSQSATKAPRGDFKPAKPWQKNESNARPESKGESAKKPYKKFDSKSKPWDKKPGGPKPFKRPGTGFKMSHKVSGIPRALPKRERAVE